MSKPFLGVGWASPVDGNVPVKCSKCQNDLLAREQVCIRCGTKVDPGRIELAEYEESVHQAIWIVLGTAKGERVMRPDFGCGIYDLVFEVNSAATAGRVSQEVQDALLYFEPRVDVLNVQVESVGEGEVLQISIDYQVRATNNVFNLVYPFYLERSLA
jgi:Bacteriophage baseplate protein W